MSSVAFLGPEGTFSHILAIRRFGRRVSLSPCSTIEAVFDSVADGSAPLGVVPIENSSGGTVYDTVDLLIRHAGKIFIREELALDVRIGLLGHSPKGIKTIYSHFIQLKHHGDWLKKKFPNVRVRAVSSTAVAAQKAAENKHSAALASPGAAEIYGLKLLERPKSTHAVNVTRFFTIAANPEKPASKPIKTALIAALPNECGSLHKFLGPFARESVSLSSIVSRPVPGQPQTYVFFMEIEGGPTNPRIAAALARAGRLAKTLSPLGTFPALPRYKS